MSFDLDQRLRVFLASAPQNIHNIQTVEFVHSLLPGRECFWRETFSGIVSDGGGSLLPARPLNMEITTPGLPSNLDQVIEVRFDTTDINDEFRSRLRAIPLDSEERIGLVYREYLSDDLETPRVEASLIVESVTYRRGVASIQAASPRLSALRTGEIYNVREIPMMRGFS